jgi:predicted deacylase
VPQRLESLLVPSATGGSPREVPVITLSARRPGPTVVITANIHGDEATGVGAVHALLGRLESGLLRGVVHLYPSLNPDGLVSASRTVPADLQDLNRLFPGDSLGNPSERLAHVLWSDIARRKPDLLLDLHADSPAAIPYILMDRATSLEGGARRRLEQGATRFAAATGLTLLREYPDHHYLEYRLDRSLSGCALNRLQVPAITVESGPRFFLEPDAVEVSVQAVLGALTAAEMADCPAPPHPTRIDGGPWRRTSAPRASVAGVFHPLAKPGEQVEKGQPIAEVRSLSGRRLERLGARQRAHIISLPERAWVVPGTAAGTLAIPDR